MASTNNRQSDDVDDVDSWNTEDAAELDRPSGPAAYEIAISARDWTVATIVQQIRQGNIDLDPAFQRRNAWRDIRRSRLIESFILGFPVPQIVLAENPRKRKSYIVIDGKQRLMTIAGFFLADYRGYWKTPQIAGLEILKQLNGVQLDDFVQLSRYAHFKRQLDNADIRATVLSGFRDEGVLYDIFYRINTGSVPLSSQELRQVLNRGKFARYLLEVTSEPNAIWTILGISEPDARLRDVELLLRLIAWANFAPGYAGNMKKFLDDAMKDLNSHWPAAQASVVKLTREVLSAVDAARAVFGDTVGRKYKARKYERSLNRALLEVEALYFVNPTVRALAKKRKGALRAGFEELSAQTAFLSSIESTTKSLENTRLRFSQFRRMLESVLKTKIQPIKIGTDN